MFFTAPLWLFAFAPWAGVVLWLLWGRRRKTPVAFLDLWRGPALQKPAKRALQPPPIYLALALTAVLSAILAAAGPRLMFDRSAAGKPITIILDRGITMSAMSGGQPAFSQIAKIADGQVREVLPDSTPVELILIPGRGTTSTTLRGWASTTAEVPASAIDTRPMLDVSLHNLLASGDGIVVVLSDRQLPTDNPRVVQFCPQTPVANVGIVQISARETPPAVMVRLRNDSDQNTVKVKVSSGSQEATRVVELPPPGQERNYFFDLPKLDAVIEASLDVKDDQSADDRAWLVRQGSPPKIEPSFALQPALRRMIDVYARSRPPTETSPTVALVDTESELPSDTPAVWLAPANGPRIKGAALATADPVTADVNWSALPAEVQTAGDPPKGWTPLLGIDGRVIVASRTEPTRKVWIGFDAPGWSATPEFVIFWANVLTWTGHGQESFAASALANYEPAWNPVKAPAILPKPASGEWPGLFRSDEGQLRAYNSPMATGHPKGRSTSDWRQRLAAARGDDRQRYDLSGPLVVLAIVLLVGACATWKRRGLTLVSAGRTF